MNFRVLGRSNIKITQMIMGTWKADKTRWVDVDDLEITKAIQTAFQAGINTFDTAEEYGWGHSERILGEALRDVRNQVIYATKVYSTHLSYEQVIEACHRSLKNLKTDYIDLYQIHWPAGCWGSEVVPIEETMRAMNYLKQQGKIRAIGVSNFSRTQVMEAVQHGQIDSLQPPYSLFWRHVEKDAMPYCVENNITILAYAPLAQGILTGKFGSGHTFIKGDIRSKHKLFKPENLGLVQKALDNLRPIAQRHRVSLGQLALAWVIAQPETCAIAGARNPEQVLENVRAVDVHLSTADLNEMDTIGRMVTDNLDNNPVMWG